MPAVTINLDDRTTYPLIVDRTIFPTVWTRPNWAAAWTLRTDMIPQQCSFKLGDESSTATLHYRYGRVILPGDNTYTDLAKITSRGYWVLIGVPTDDGNPFYWLGYAESPIDSFEHLGRDGIPDAGIQTIPCFGFLNVLRQNIIRTTVFDNPDGTDTPKRNEGATSFNDGEQGNRNITKREQGTATNPPTSYVFADPSDENKWWSTRDIIEYLFTWQLPTEDNSPGPITWKVNGLDRLPDWDRPTVKVNEQTTVADVLAELISPSRLLNFGISVDATPGTPPTINNITVEVTTTVASAITLPAAFGDVAANDDTTIINNTTDPHTEFDVTTDDSDVHDMLVVEGPPDIGVATFVYSDFEVFWVDADKIKYEEGGINSTGWAALKQFEKRERNRAIRDDAKLRKVFRTFKLKREWDGLADGEDVFAREAAATEAYVPFLGNCRFMQRLPLYEGVDYTDINAADETDATVFLPNGFFLENPESGQIEDFRFETNLPVGFNVRNAQALPFQIDGQVNNLRMPKIELNVSGAPQHAIAADDFTPNEADVPQSKFAGYHYNTLRATLALQSDRRPQFQLPASVTADVVRRKVLRIDHPTFERVYVAPGAIVGYDDEANLIVSVGGTLRDPIELLEAVATVGESYYLNPRKRCVVDTSRRLSAMSLGRIITTVNGENINAQVIEIKFTFPINRSDATQATTARIVAAAQRVDLMSLLRPLEEVANESRQVNEDDANN